MYPSSNPTCKFLDCANGVVGGSTEDWEFSEGIAREDKGKLRVTAMAKESRLGRRIGFALVLRKLTLGVRGRAETERFKLLDERGIGGNGERREHKIMMFISLQNDSGGAY